MTDSKILQGRKGIANYLNVNQKTVGMLISDGLPVNKINGRLFSHTDDIDRYFKSTVKPTNQAQYFQRVIYLLEQVLDRMSELPKK